MKIGFSRRTSSIIVGGCAVIVTVAPIVGTMRAITRQRDRLEQGFAVEAIRGLSKLPHAGDSVDLRQQVASYLAVRDPLIDELMPGGAGGSRYFSELDGHAGEAFTETASIGLLAGNLSAATEIHERAHLLDAAVAGPVAQLMTKVASPEPSEYAAKNVGEHFAEMAREAWDILRPDTAMCPALTRVEALREAEHQVPGTAGFVSRFLQHPGFSRVADRELVQALADSIAMPVREEWRAVWRGLDAQRNNDGTFRAWPKLTVLYLLKVEQSGDWGRRSLFGYLNGAMLWPAIWLMRLMGGRGDGM